MYIILIPSTDMAYFIIHLHKRTDYEQYEQFINASINVPQCFISLTHIHKDGHCFPLLLSIFHPCSAPVSGSHTLYGIDLLRKPRASRKIKFFSVTFDDFNTHYKNCKYFSNSELQLTEISLLVSLNSTKCEGVMRKGKET